MAKFILMDEEAPNAAQPPVARAKFTLLDDYDPTGSGSDNALAGAGKVVADMARGAGQRVREFLEPGAGVFLKAEGKPVPNPVADAIGLPTESDVAEARRLDEPLMRTKGGKIGNFAGNVAVAAPAIAMPASNTWMGAGVLGSLMGWLQPTAEGESSTKNAAIGGGAGMIGKGIGDKLSSGVRSVMDWLGNRGAQQASANAAKDATRVAAQEAGYVVPPTQANPSSWNKLLESLSGKIQTAQHASARNQEVTNRLAKEALGLPVDQPITQQALKAVRDQAGQAYEAIAQGQYVTDATFKGQIRALADGQRMLAAQFPGLADDTAIKLATQLEQAAQMDGRVLVELTKSLRDKANVAFKDGASEVGRLYKGAAGEIEDLIERNLLYTGSGGRQALDAFQQARQQIAKSYTVEAALNGSNVNAATLAAQLKRGKPLDGGLRSAAEFAQSFPKAAQLPQKMGSVLPGSPLDWAVAGGLSAYNGDPNMLALGLARPAARSILLSRPYQVMMTTPSYGPGASMRMLSSMVDSEPFRRLAPAAAASEALAVSK